MISNYKLGYSLTLQIYIVFSLKYTQNVGVQSADMLTSLQDGDHHSGVNKMANSLPRSLHQENQFYFVH